MFSILYKSNVFSVINEIFLGHFLFRGESLNTFNAINVCLSCNPSASSFLFMYLKSN